MARFHDHQAETLRVHAQYLKSQEEFSQNFVKLVEQQFDLARTDTDRPSGYGMKNEKVEPKPDVTVTPAKVQSIEEHKLPPAQKPLPENQLQKRPQVTGQDASTIVAHSGNGNGTKPTAQTQSAINSPKTDVSTYDVETLTNSLLKVVSEKTGYPVEMLELSSDMEADLGIDSIKRVEIMGAMRSLFPNLPKADPEAFAEMRTLGQIVHYMSARPAETAASPTPAATVQTEPLAESPAGSYDEKTLTISLLAVVSEKTGYPVEMLELSSDMEADLGIDSIKRVEIMGAMRAQFPDLPMADPEAFAEMRTLGQIIQYMSPKPGEAANSPTPAATGLVEELQVPPVQDPATLEATVTEYDIETLKTSLLNIVSEKTGYPVEMLDLSLDLDADLGIDSIKRVEIMGALRTSFPNLPKADPETFAEARTLGKIIDYLGKSDSKENADPQLKVEVKSTSPAPSIPRGIVNFRSLPEPYLRNCGGGPGVDKAGLEISCAKFSYLGSRHTAAAAGGCRAGDTERLKRRTPATTVSGDLEEIWAYSRPGSSKSPRCGFQNRWNILGSGKGNYPARFLACKTS